MEKEFNSVVSGVPPKSLIAQAHDKFTRMALTAIDRDHPEAYKGCCHSYTAHVMQANLDKLGDDDKIVLLGGANTIAHSILVSKDGKILADSEFKQKGIDVQLDMQAGLYRVEMIEGSGQYINMNVAFSATIGEFKQGYLKPVEEKMYAKRADSLKEEREATAKIGVQDPNGF